MSEGDPTPASAEEGFPSPGIAEGDVYTAPQAARVLGISDRRVRQMLEAGELEGERDSSGKWWTPQRVVHEVLEERGSPRGRRSPAPGVASPYEDVLRESPATPYLAPDDRESLRELMARVEDLSYRLGRTEARAELTERAESTVREERDRLLRELDEERAERRRLAERLERLEEERGREEESPVVLPRPELPDEPPEVPSTDDEARRLRPWWLRWFGG